MMDKMKKNVNLPDPFEYKYPELIKEGRYTSPTSALPLHELKVFQDYIHSVNIQTLGAHLPHFKKQLILIKFFKSKKYQLVEIFSRYSDQIIHTVGKVHTIGRNFVMIKTLFARIWIPFDSIHSAKTPFGITQIHDSHQNVVINNELRKKLLTNFSQTVSNKEVLKQQFFEELLETNLKTWQGTKLTIFTDKPIKGKILNVVPGKIYLKHREVLEIATTQIMYIKQGRFASFFQRLISNWFGHKK
ncbi:hypothetical protein [Solibacillus daqui]|uniref:hypothetical protein n=1 Tax=Solibacillus daqui TaxID=2912187 RepID=UPI002366497E|nr:hypothetical protein [Solibacillus daqui]